MTPQQEAESSAHSKHSEVGRRKDYHGVWSRVTAWWLLPAHLLWSTFVAVAFLYLNEKSFPPNRDHLFDRRLYQSDVVTIMSSFLVISRLFVTNWVPLCAWRCVFVLFEKTGVSLLDIKNILSTNLLLPWGKDGPSRERILCAFILLLTWPAQLSSPIASGSISWVLLSGANRTSHDLIIPKGDSNPQIWNRFLQEPFFREVVTKTAVSRAAMSYDVFNVAENIDVVPAQRISPAFQLAPESRIESVRAPTIFLDNAVWINRSDLPKEIEEALNNTTSGCLNATRPTSPLLAGYVKGNCAILKDWHDRAGGRTWNGIRYAALLVGIVKQPHISDQCDTYFEDQSGGMFRYPLDNKKGIGCFKILQMNVTAGVRSCETSHEKGLPRLRCLVKTPSVATLFEDSGNGFYANLSSLTRKNVSNHEYLPDVFALMPEVMQELVIMKGATNNGATVNGDIARKPDLYLRSMITSSYQGIWSALEEVVSPGLSENVTYFPRIDVIRAEVAKERILLWWLLNGLVTLSGCVLIWLQSHCDGDPVQDWVMPGKSTFPFRGTLSAWPYLTIIAVFLDNALLLKDNRQNLSNATKIQEADKELPLIELKMSGKNEDPEYRKLGFVN